MKNGIVLHGNITVDTIIKYTGTLHEGSNCLTNKTTIRPGGIMNVAIALRKMGYEGPLGIHGVLGQDSHGKLIKSFINIYEMIDFTQVEKTVTTDIAYILVNETKRLRTGLVKWQASPHINTYDTVGEKYVLHHIAYVDALPSMDITIDKLQKHGCGISVDLAGTAKSQTNLRLVDLLFIAKEDVKKILDPQDRIVPAVIHTPNQIQLNYETEPYSFFPNASITNPLGAGDFLAAAVLLFMFDNNETPTLKDLPHIQKQVENLLLRYQ